MFFLIKAIYLTACLGHGSCLFPLHVFGKLLQGSILVVYVSARCRPVLVNSCVDLVVEDNRSTVRLSHS